MSTVDAQDLALFFRHVSNGEEPKLCRRAMIDNVTRWILPV
ncbi:hypothetical protein ABHV46_11780 [Asaia sp. BMEF1]